MTNCAILLILGAYILGAWAYPTTVPNSSEVCLQMTPGHGPSPQKSKSPFSIMLSKNAVKGGQNVKVTLESKDENRTFRGFYIQARDGKGGQVGTFIADAGVVKTHSCSGIKNSAAHHSSKDDKDTLDVHWTAPKGYSGTVTFVATFVEQFETFWTFVKSEPLTVSNIKQPDILIPPQTDSREEGASSEATQKSRVLNYNPYSPFSPLQNGEFNSKDFLLSLTKRNDDFETTTPHQNSTFLQEKIRRRKNSRIRKHYIPPHGHDDFLQTPVLIPHQEANLPVPVPSPVSSRRYKYFRGQIPEPDESYLSTPGPSGGGFHYLDKTNPRIRTKSGPSRQIKFYDDTPTPTPTTFYRPVEGSSYGYGHGHGHGWGWAPSPTPPSPVIRKPTYSTYSYSYPKPSLNHGIIVKDADITDTAIVLPKNFKSYEMPRYGYLVFNPKRGPPFYLIPADTEAFEETHFGWGPGSGSGVSAYARSNRKA